MGAEVTAAQAASTGMATVWFAVLWFSLIAFGAMVVVCGAFGFRDILSMFQALQEEPDTLYEE